MIHDRITVDPKIMFGKPVIKGTRITVEEVDEIGRTMRLRAARQLTLSYETASKLSVVRSTKPRSRRASAPRRPPSA